jgi:hypothetical protein
MRSENDRPREGAAGEIYAWCAFPPVSIEPHDENRIEGNAIRQKRDGTFG